MIPTYQHTFVFINNKMETILVGSSFLSFFKHYLHILKVICICLFSCKKIINLSYN